MRGRGGRKDVPGSARAGCRQRERNPGEQLRAARELTQEHLAALPGIKQASISKMERRTDMYIGTLSKFIEAMGGQLEIRACFPDGSVRITQFSEKARRDLQD